MKRMIVLAMVLVAIVYAQTTKKPNTSVRTTTVQNAERINDNDTQSKFDFYPTIGYQGLLKDNEGKLVTDGTYKVSFKIYDSETSETAIWKEIQDVEISKGIISCHIGAAEKLNLPFDKQYWLSVSVNDDELPRMIMGGTPYSLHARRISEDAIVGGKNISVSKGEDGKIVLSGEGSGKTATNNLFDGSNSGIYQIDCNSTTGNHSVAMGNQSNAGGDSSAVALGKSCTSSGRSSVALGGWNKATGNMSVAIGSQNSTSSNALYSVAIGSKNSISGSSNSIAIGRLNTVSDYHSVAIGSSNTIDSLYSYAIGYGCNNNRQYTYSIGTGVVNSASNSIKLSTYSSGAMFNVGKRFVSIGLNDSLVNLVNNVWPVTLPTDSTWYPNHPKNSLFVAETIFAKALELKTEVWADYVFSNDYNLKPLTEVEKFIQENNHLPGMIPEKEALNKGVNVGDIQVKLLEKIEELTLYIIDQEKRIKELEKSSTSVE